MPWPFPRAGDHAIRRLRTADAAGLAELHAQCFPRGWSRGEFEALLAAREVEGHGAYAAAAPERPGGFILSRCAGEEADVLSVAVSVALRGQGLAARLLRVHLDALREVGVRHLFLEVEEENAPARRLYARQGFEPVGRREAYYPRRDSSSAAAIVLRAALG